MVRSTGSFTPGRAAGTHSGYGVGGFQIPQLGSPTMGPVWGMLRRQQALKEAQSRAQLG